VHVVATAGHVDHGKSTLVSALTGQEPDRLEEERRRGLSIQLGYCWTRLPGVGDIAFVDVPGHERFISTALSGMGPVPAVMFVVAADDPWMPQAAEHLAALDALDVRHGLLVVTRSDLADPRSALTCARAELSKTSLSEVEAVTVSARTGKGLGDVREALARMLSELPTPPTEAPVRLWVDRRFHVRGAGTVVTGTLPAGTISVGDVLEHRGTRVRVRGIECLGERVDAVSGTARVALELAGRGTAEIARGDVLVSPEELEPTRVADLRIVGDGLPPERPLLHIGASARSVRTRPLGERHVRVTLDTPLPLRLGDRALLRDPGSRSLWGAEVLDPSPPSLRRRGAATARGRALASIDLTLPGQVRGRGLVTRSFLRRIGAVEGPLPEGALEAGDFLVSATRAGELTAEVARIVAASQDPQGPTLGALARALDVEEGVVAAVVRPPLRLVDGRVRSAADDLPPRLEAALRLLRDDLQGDPFAAPHVERLRELGLDAGALARLHRHGDVLRIGDSVVLLPGADDLAVRRLEGVGEEFTASEARVAWGTSRRVALALLSHLDRTGRTVRLPDDRRRLRGK
jgi:selenocysteine-specific elongation factor